MHRYFEHRLRLVAVVTAGFGLIAFAMTGCAPRFKAVTLVPARGGDTSKLNPIAVVDFSGKEGDVLQGDVEAMLVNTEVQGQPYFTVVDRAAVDRVMNEIAFGRSGLVDEKTAVKIGKLVGAKGIVLGQVTTNAVYESHFQEERSQCLDKDRPLWSFKPCENLQRQTVSCTKSDAHFTFTPKIIDVLTGHIVASETLTGSVSDQACQDEAPIKDENVMLSEARQQALQEFRKLVAPHTIDVALTVLTKDETERPERATDMLAQGATWAKAGRLDRSCDLWQESYKIHPYGYAVHYDLGLCAEYYRGDFREALKYYEMADKLSPKPIKAISAALGRAKTGLSNQAKLDQQLGRKQQLGNAEEETNSIADVQRWLNKLGYDAGVPDGVLGQRTKAAIRAYQNDYRLPVDGEITDDLLKSLRQKSAGRI